MSKKTLLIIKEFLRPSLSKTVLPSLAMICFFYFGFLDPWSSFTPITGFLYLFGFPFLIAEDLSTLSNNYHIIGLVLTFVWTYIVMSALVALFRKYPQKKKMLMSILAVLFFFLLGFDVYLVNNTVNTPDYSCNLDVECAAKPLTRMGCSPTVCVNEDWNLYQGLINEVFALDCFSNPKICTCEQSTCQTKPLYKNKDPRFCSDWGRDDYEKAECYRITARNLNISDPCDLIDFNNTIKSDPRFVQELCFVRYVESRD